MPTIALGWRILTTKNALLEGEFAEVDNIFRCGNQVDELTHFRFEGSFQEKLEKVNIAWVSAEMEFE